MKSREIKNRTFFQKGLSLDMGFITPTKLYYDAFNGKRLPQSEPYDYELVVSILNRYAQERGFEDFDAMYFYNLSISKQPSGEKVR